MDTKFDRILRKVAVGPYTENSRFAVDMGFDSLTFTGLIQELEDAYGKEVSYKGLDHLPITVGELRKLFQTT